MNFHPSMNCHPERSEGPAVHRNNVGCRCPILARSVRKGGIPRTRPAGDLCVALDFGWRSGLPLR